MSLGCRCVSVACADDLRGPLGRTFSANVRVCLLARLFASDTIRLVLVLRLRLRGLFGRSCQCATVPLPVPSWTPADHQGTSALGQHSPDTDLICSIVLRTPGRSIIIYTPGRWAKVQGSGRAGKESQGFACLRQRINTVTRGVWISPSLVRGWYTKEA